MSDDNKPRAFGGTELLQQVPEGLAEAEAAQAAAQPAAAPLPQPASPGAPPAQHGMPGAPPHAAQAPAPVAAPNPSAPPDGAAAAAAAAAGGAPPAPPKKGMSQGQLIGIGCGVLAVLMLCGVGLSGGGYFMYQKKKAERRARIAEILARSGSGSSTGGGLSSSNSALKIYENTSVDSLSKYSVDSKLSSAFSYKGYKNMGSKRVANADIVTVAIGKGSLLTMYKVLLRPTTSMADGHAMAKRLRGPNSAYRVGNRQLLMVNCVAQATYDKKIGKCTSSQEYTVARKLTE